MRLPGLGQLQDPQCHKWKSKTSENMMSMTGWGPLSSTFSFLNCFPQIPQQTAQSLFATVNHLQLASGPIYNLFSGDQKQNSCGKVLNWSSTEIYFTNYSSRLLELQQLVTFLILSLSPQHWPNWKLTRYKLCLLYPFQIAPSNFFRWLRTDS